jgi:hypothetical protein
MEQFDPLRHHRIPVESLDAKAIQRRVEEIRGPRPKHVLSVDRDLPALRQQRDDLTFRSGECKSAIDKAKAELRPLNAAVADTKKKIAYLEPQNTRPAAHHALRFQREALEKLEHEQKQWNDELTRQERILAGIEKIWAAFPHDDYKRLLEDEEMMRVEPLKRF